MRDDSYTFEDYLKDFELDYLGFDGVSPEPVPDQCSERSADNDPEPETEESDESGETKIEPNQRGGI